jgi:replicative DNA helicase
VLSQLNRGGQGLDKIRDSGEIAQVADVVILMEPESESSGVVSIVVNFLKNRFGPVGMTTVLFYGPYQRFEGMTEEVYG